MRAGARVRSWLRATLHRSRAEREMASELSFHIERYTEDLVRSGVPIEEARRRECASARNPYTIWNRIVGTTKKSTETSVVRWLSWNVLQVCEEACGAGPCTYRRWSH